MRSSCWASATVLFATGGIGAGRARTHAEEPAGAGGEQRRDDEQDHDPEQAAAPGVALAQAPGRAWPRRAGAPSPRPGPACAGRACWRERGASAGPSYPAPSYGRLVRGGQRSVGRTPRGTGHHGGRVAAGAARSSRWAAGGRRRPQRSWASRWAAAAVGGLPARPAPDRCCRAAGLAVRPRPAARCGRPPAAGGPVRRR